MQQQELRGGRRGSINGKQGLGMIMKKRGEKMMMYKRMRREKRPRFRIGSLSAAMCVFLCVIRVALIYQ